MSDFDDLLDATLDDLQDLPSFKPFPIGAHRVLATIGTKDINGKLAVTLEFKMIENVEMANSQEELPKEGDTSSTMFFLGNKYAEGALKLVAAPIMKELNLSSIRELVEQAHDVECVIITGLRKDKNDPDKFYLDVKEIDVV